MKHEREKQPRPSALVALKRGLWQAVNWHFPGFPFWITAGLALIALLPLLGLAFASTPPEVWQWISPRLPLLASHSLWLVAGVALVSGLLGTGLAGLVELCDFPGRRFLASALLLPVAIPAYVQGFVVLHLFNAHEAAPQLWQADAPWFPIRSMGGPVLSLSLSLYPFVYLAARHGFQTQSGRAMEAARSLGAGPLKAFFRAGLPVAFPWIGASMAWVALETLADLGTVSLFRYETFTTALYQVWPSSLPTAQRLAGLLLILAAGFNLLKHHQGWRLGLYQSFGGKPTRPAGLSKLPGFCALACAALVLGVAFVIPLGLLLAWGVAGIGKTGEGGIVEPFLHSVLMALGGAGLIMSAALAVGLAQRRHPSRAFGWLVRASTSGYWLPGAVWAAGIAGLAAILNDSLMQCCQAGGPSMPDSGISLLLLAYLIRFAGPAFALTGRALEKITPGMMETAHGLGVSGQALWRQIYFPLLWQDLLGAFLLVFTVLLQELPITLLLRPAGFETLPVRMMALATQSQWEGAALPALCLVLAGLPLALGLRTGAFRHV